MSTLRLDVMNDTEVERFHRATLDVLEKVGLKITHDHARQALQRHGAKVDDAGERVYLPADMVEEFRTQAPSSYEIADMSGARLTVGSDQRLYGALVIDPFIIDYQQGARPPVLEDVRRHTILGDSLDRVHIMHRMEQPVVDVPGPQSYLKTLEVFLTHTSKHIHIMPTNMQDCRRWMELATVILDAAGLDAHTTPLLTVGMAVTSPLQIHGPNVDIMQEAIQHGYPIYPTICPMAGTTSPYSVAGTALLCNAEALAVVVLTQVLKPGYPVLYAAGPSVTDLKNGTDLYYHIAKMHLKLIGGRMAGFYNLPLSGEASGTMTSRYDPQNGAEGICNLLASFAQGQHIIQGLGSMHNANGMSAEQIVIQCALVDMAEYFARGVDFSDYKLAVDTIGRVGPGGNYLTDDMTLDLLRSKEFASPDLFDMTGGHDPNSPGMVEKAHDRVQEILSSYKPTVPHKIQDAIVRHLAQQESNISA